MWQLDCFYMVTNISCMKSIYPASFKKIITQTCFAAVLLMTGPGISSARAQTAANWNFNNVLTGTAGSNLSAGTVSLGSSIVSSAYNGGTEFYGQDGWPATSLDPNAYLQFNINGNPGYYLVLNSVTLVIRRSSTGSPAGSGPNAWSLRSSLDNYATDIITGTMTLNYATFTIALPAAFQSIPSAVTFRVYGYNMTVSSGGNSRFVFDNISIQGQAFSGVLATQSLTVTATSVSGAVDLQWQEEGFPAGTDYIVERSADGTDFTDVGQQTSSTAETATFRYQDALFPAVSKLFYRIRAQQPDGVIVWSTTEALTLKQADGGSVIRSVVAQGGSLKTLFHLASAGNYQLTIWSADGKALSRQMIQEQAGDPVADLSFGSHPHGIYILTLAGPGVNSSREFVY
jgi:hypothetical protein